MLEERVESEFLEQPLLIDIIGMEVLDDVLEGFGVD